MSTRVTFSEQPVLRFPAEASSGSESENISSTEGKSGMMKSFSSSLAQLAVSMVLKLLEEDSACCQVGASLPKKIWQFDIIIDFLEANILSTSLQSASRKSPPDKSQRIFFVTTSLCHEWVICMPATFLWLRWPFFVLPTLVNHRQLCRHFTHIRTHNVDT